MIFKSILVCLKKKKKKICLAIHFFLDNYETRVFVLRSQLRNTIVPNCSGSVPQGSILLQVLYYILIKFPVAI